MITNHVLVQRRGLANGGEVMVLNFEDGVQPPTLTAVIQDVVKTAASLFFMSDGGCALPDLRIRPGPVV